MYSGYLRLVYRDSSLRPLYSYLAPVEREVQRKLALHLQSRAYSDLVNKMPRWCMQPSKAACCGTLV